MRSELAEKPGNSNSPVGRIGNPAFRVRRNAIPSYRIRNSAFGRERRVGVGNRLCTQVPAGRQDLQEYGALVSIALMTYIGAFI